MKALRDPTQIGVRYVALLVALMTLRVSALVAQGAAFLLVPYGARAVGRGEAVVADTTLGTEAIWWNAAALSRMPERELAFHNITSVASNVFVLSGAVPSKKVGAFGLAAFLFDYGTTPSTDRNGNHNGSLSSRNYLLEASYASPVGQRASVGVTAKFLAYSYQCSGLCDQVSEVFGSTNAIDLGAQYRLPDRWRTTVGAAVRNIGQPLQFRDKDQADPLPRLLQLGARTRVPIGALSETGATFDVAADVVRVTGIAGMSESVGAILGYKEQVFVAGGYKRIDGNGGGPSIGFSYQQGTFGIDISQRFDSFASSAGLSPPTYVALRLKF